MNIAFIGGGNMASALIGGLLKQNWPAEAISVFDVDAAARQRVETHFRVRAHADPASAIAPAECVLFAVKPQQLRASAQANAAAIGQRLVISIAAGIRAHDLARWLNGHSRIVRAMPNTPALVLAGIAGLYALPGASTADRGIAEKVLGAAGATLWVKEEAELDGITAVSGSGPAYVFYFIEALQQAAVELGFSEDTARNLAMTTFSGAVKLAGESQEAVATLRARVTSKGGTTERALRLLEEHGVKQRIVEAVAAAAVRSRELGEDLGKDS